MIYFLWVLGLLFTWACWALNFQALKDIKYVVLSERVIDAQDYLIKCYRAEIISLKDDYQYETTPVDSHFLEALEEVKCELNANYRSI